MIRLPNGLQLSFKLVILTFTTLVVMSVATIGFIFFSTANKLPKMMTMDEYQPLGVTQIIAKDGKDETVIAEFYKERRYVLPLEQVPEALSKAFIAAEDDSFFKHGGFDLASILRAGVANFMAGQVVQGGSTITQQVAKSLFLSPERSFIRKFKELILAQRLEKNLNKQQILYLYLNQIYLGHGAHGVQAAARAYFRKDAGKLTLAEMALLAGLPRAPSKFSPFSNPKRAKERQLYVLKRMKDTGVITESQAIKAGEETLKLYLNDEVVLPEAAYIVEHLRRYLVAKYSEKTVYEEGLRVVIPASPQLYKVSAQSLQSGLREVDKRRGYRGPIKKLALAEVEPFLKLNQEEVFKTRFQYQFFNPEGTLSTAETMAKSGLSSELAFLQPGELYQAVVTSMPITRSGKGADKNLFAKIRLFSQEHNLNLDDAAWANIGFKTHPLTAGDIVWVKLQKREKTLGTFTLEQIPQVQGALLSLDVQTGQILSMAGGYNFTQSEFNRATQAKRQPGSAFKPMIYSAALEKGYTPATVIVDSPIVYNDGENGKWKPANFEEKFYGDTTFRQALINSRNIPTIKIVQSVGVHPLIEYSRRLGFTGNFNQDLSIALGSSLTNLMELTQVYALFPRNGKRLEPVYFNVIQDRHGKTLEEGRAKPVAHASPLPGASSLPESPMSSDGSASVVLNDRLTSEQLLDPRVAYVMTHLMKEVVDYGTGRKAKSLGRAVAGKTGTTNEYKDAWFMGFTPSVVTGVWVGFDDQQSLGAGETGANAALPIWLSFMNEAVKKYPDADFMVPEDIEFALIDAKTGRVVSPNTPGAIREAFIRGSIPTQKSVSTPDTEDSQGEFLKEDFE